MYQSQNKIVRAILDRGETITSLEACIKYGMTNLRARIYDLRNDYDMNIDKNTIRNGRSHYAEYYLVEESCLQNTK